jgi:hypothetical protein
MYPRIAVLSLVFLPVLCAGQDLRPDPQVPLTVPSGAPLRLYLTGRVSKKAGKPAQAKILDPVYAFDREVIPAGSLVTGTVSRVQPVTKGQRLRAILNGDFTPLRTAFLSFNTLTLPDGKSRPLTTVETLSLNSIYVEPSKKKKAKGQAQTGPQTQNNGILGTAKTAARDKLKTAIAGRTRGFSDVVRGPNKKEKLVDLLWSKLPYHPQYLRRGTRIDAPLREDLAFGTESLKAAELSELGSQPAPDAVAHVRLLTALDSHSAAQGNRVEAVVTAPLFSAQHKLVLPEGSRILGAIVLAKKARSFHRSGQLRFNFQTLELPPAITAWQRETVPASQPAAQPAASAKALTLRTQAVLDQAEGSGPASLKVDSEGGVRAQESKTRFLAPAISLMLASRAADNDAGRHHDTGAAGTGNVDGRTAGGGLGFGMLGAAISQTSPYVGMAFGYYGLAWSVYRSVVAKGGEVQFDRNAMMDIRFNARPKGVSKFVEAADAGGQ